VKNERIVIAGSGPLLLASADTAKKAEAQVLYVAEQAASSSVRKFALQLWRWPSKIIQALSLPYRLYQPNSYVVEAIGQERLERVRLQTPKGIIEIECDRLACGFGLVPNTQLGQLMGCQIKDNAITVDDYQRTSQPQVWAAGECTGFGGSELAMVEGSIAGYAAIGQNEKARQLFAQRQRYRLFAHLLEKSFKLRAELKTLARPETIFCRCEDVTFDKVAERNSWIDAKLHTRCGMGACQGSTCATAAACLFDWQLPNSRPPLLPTRVKSLMAMSTSPLNQK
ncbi:TPA: NAD(P)/FAD-dependent oxidoreductase, partial [Acinetobacter baumannii]|nr:NAD(P)/FAD-dependent oxidoreductase [Acinetobacter baumannii]HAV4123249.1 NAD(P)/FAD-dependent oxidoreductase [Acinetobacter baumannii]HAV4135466.1 NAD(P)/FAD-dependent oxidoreductase [Acinetobacter baumannii]